MPILNIFCSSYAFFAYWLSNKTSSNTRLTGVNHALRKYDLHRTDFHIFGHSMHSDQINAYSDKEPSDALAKALSRAVWQSVGAANAHIIVQDILSVGAGWKANINVVLQPKANDVSAQSTRIKGFCKYWYLEASEVKKKAPTKRSKHDQYLQLLRKKKINASAREKSALRQALNIDIGFLHLYIEDIYEGDFRAIEDQFYFDTVHILSGALWEEANRHHPDIEMYEAAYNVQGRSSDDEPEPKKLKRTRHEIELIDKLSY